jgi:hypothetical protein
MRLHDKIKNCVNLMTKIKVTEITELGWRGGEGGREQQTEKGERN